MEIILFPGGNTSTPLTGGATYPSTGGQAPLPGQVTEYLLVPSMLNTNRRHICPLCAHWRPLAARRVFAARGKGQWCRFSDRQHPSVFSALNKLKKKYKLTLTRCNADVKISNFSPQMPPHAKCRPGRPASLAPFPPPLLTPTQQAHLSGHLLRMRVFWSGTTHWTL